MAIKKKKISELPLAESLTGLHTIGVDAENNSVKVGLEFVKTAADRADQSAQTADQATIEARTATIETRLATDEAIAVTDQAQNATQAAEQSATYATEQGLYALQQGDAARTATETIGQRIESGLAALVGSAPEALDTLQELASALGNDENFAVNVTSAIAERAMTNDPRLSDNRNAINQNGASTIKFWTGNQAQYDASDKAADTLYFIL